MNLSRLRVLWLLTGVFGAIIAAELFWPGAGGPKPVPRPDRAASAAAAPSMESPKTWIATILARPLFNPDRRSREAPPGPTVAGRPEPPRLSGILITPDGARAIFAGGLDERPVVAAKGARLGPWEILEIGAEQVRLSGPDGERTIRLRYANTPAAPPPAIKPQPQGMPLLPLLPLAATQSAESPEEPSGASIFSNAPLPPAIRTIH